MGQLSAPSPGEMPQQTNPAGRPERGRKRVTVFHKVNIMKLTDGLFIRCAKEIHDREFPEIAYQELIIDAGCLRLVQDPTQFDVLLMENLYGGS